MENKRINIFKRFWRERKIRLYYTGVICLIMTLSILLAVAVTVALYLSGVVESIVWVLFLWLPISGLLAGAIFSFVLSTMVFRPILSLSDASKRVAAGDFSVRLPYRGRLEELRTTYTNFNDMVEQLGTIETLRNDFVANVSHEFKTPLSVIEGYAMLLQDAELPAAEREESLARILEASGRLSDLVSNILLISKIDNGAFPETKTVFRLDEQLRQALLQFEPQWTEKALQLDVELPSVQIEAPEPMLMQVWTNLIGNAVKFSPDGGTVSIRLTEEGESVVVTVTDAGEGMSEETRRHIFEKFYQGDTAHRTEGNGLGLALVKKIVTHVGGSIAVESAPNAGSTFTVRLQNPKI